MTARDSNGIVAAWCAVGDCDRGNGCLCFIPGSHKRGMRKHGYPQWQSKHNMGYLGIQDLTETEIASRVHCEMKAGDVVFFHPQTIHGSGVNSRTIQDFNDGDESAFRKAISVHYQRKDLLSVDHSKLPHNSSIIDAYGPKEAENYTREERGALHIIYFNIHSRDL